MNYVPHTPEDKAKILGQLGLQSSAQLFDVIPEGVRLQRELDLPPELAEHDLVAHLEELAAKNTVAGQACFLGAGAYRHYIPAVVDMVVSRSEFMTAYTPYQPEVSQGTLQTIFEFQTMMCQLTGMDVCNASVYDGGCAALDAVLMALSITGRQKVVVSAGVQPQIRELLHTYLSDEQLLEVPLQSGRTQLPELGEDTACVLFQMPNFLGVIEDASSLCRSASQAGALSVAVVSDPACLALLKNPGQCGVDIAVGDAQPLGVPLSFGGPYAGFVACKKSHMRRIPGRLCGLTVDSQGRRGYCLTLQAREQHIRREKAFSNICTNQGLCALAVTVYLALLGPQGLREVAQASLKLAHYFKREVAKLAGYRLPLGDIPVFHEILVECPAGALATQQHLEKHGILGGYDVSRDYPQYSKGLLFCFTETTSKSAVDRLLAQLAACPAPLEGALR